MSNLAISFLSVIPVREKASNTSQMVSQILFGETFKVLEKNGEWLFIETTFDNYQGWIDEKMALYIDDNEVLNQEFITKNATTLLLKGADKQQVLLTAGSTIPNFKNGAFSFVKENYVVGSNSVTLPGFKNFGEELVAVAKQFLNTPYLWGGRSCFGIDCSGFSQIVFKILGIKILRDAFQQAEQGKLVDFLSEAKAGDLAFFDNEEGRITHVGIMLNNHEIIHASGRVKIDKIDNQGIFSGDLNKYSHKLRIIKRFV